MADFEWDEEKNLANQRKHGISLEARQEIHSCLDRRRASFETAAFAASSG